MSDSLPAIDLRRIEEASLNSLQTQRQLFYDGWVLRVAPGKAKRARSVNAHFGSSLPLERKIAYCERLYAQRNLPTLFRVTPFVAPGDLDAKLEARGYVAFDPTLVQVRRLDEPPPVHESNVQVRALPPREFIGAVAALQGLSADQRAAHLERISESPLGHRAVVAFRGDEVVGCGHVALEDDIAGVFSMVTATHCRGEGIASTVLGALLTWAWEHGASQAYLQVDRDNEPALAVYRRFGFVTAYTYHYRGRPEEMR